MNRVIEGQYNGNSYPLARYVVSDIPKNIMTVINKISEDQLGIVRGGLAFVFMLNCSDYVLKDIDMVALVEDKNQLLEYVTGADEVYLNKNSFGSDVITAFWRENEAFYKLDILLCDKLPKSECHVWDSTTWNTVTASFLWMNRICKIAEKKQRHHNDEKTLNHYRVANAISDYLLNKNILLEQQHINTVISKIPEATEVLGQLISSKEIKLFFEKQMKLVSKG